MMRKSQIIRRSAAVILLAGAVLFFILLPGLRSGRISSEKSIHPQPGEIQKNTDELLADAAARGDCVMIGYCIGQKANINALSSNGRSPLMLAAENGHNDAVVILLHAGADPEKTDTLHYTALALAAKNNHVQVMQTLLRFGASLNAGDSTGKTALLAACQAGSAGAVELLLQHNAALWPGQSAGAGPVVSALQQRHFSIAVRLLEKGADANETDPDGNSVLMLAASGGNVEMVKYLLEHHQIDRFHANQAGQTALDIARQNNNQQLVDLLQLNN